MVIKPFYTESVYEKEHSPVSGQWNDDHLGQVRTNDFMQIY